MIQCQSGWVGRQKNGRKLWSRGCCIYKIEIPIYRFFRYFFFGIRYFSVFGIPASVLVSVFWNTSVFGIGIGYRPRTTRNLYIHTSRLLLRKKLTKLVVLLFIAIRMHRYLFYLPSGMARLSEPEWLATTTQCIPGLYRIFYSYSIRPKHEAELCIIIRPNSTAKITRISNNYVDLLAKQMHI